MAERWIPGIIEVSEQMYLMLAVDVDARSDDSHPDVLSLTVSLRSPQGAYGMPSQAELPQLDAVQAEVVRLLRPRGEVFARLTGDRKRVLLAHASSGAEFFPTREAAERACRGFDPPTWRVRVTEQAGDREEGWRVVISQVEIVSPERIAHYSAMFRAVAAEEGGRLDGWGASV